ncbi:MAG: putative Isoleucine--tRNA ligase [Streblomastix strix]|uniref:Putative Isoleucine--tRNA ligase n=1 Tax=Streblomastix strix TaxID=222440 RepID=A0A5J4SIF4_9EUKA|nr:MAG: putative Isoleucine--tRNA ligase [Streblomastix strix]
MDLISVKFSIQNKDVFANSFPAEFIAEGIGQTHGWFYMLLVVPTTIFRIAPFKNLIVNGIVSSSYVQKKSKRLKNYTDHVVIFNRHGVYAIRLYLVSSLAVHAGDLPFKEEGVQEIICRVLIAYNNAMRLFEQQTFLFNWKIKDIESQSSSSSYTSGNDFQDFVRKYEDEKDQLDSVHYSLIPKEMPIIARNESVILEKKQRKRIN